MDIQNSNTLQPEKNSAHDLFLYLVVFLSLGFVSFGEGAILFGFINKFIAAEKLYMSSLDFYQGSVKFGIAALLIAGPIFFLVSWIISRRIREEKISLDSIIRKWLTYIVLFFAAATIIGDLITLVINFLSGDYTASFLLKVFVVLLIASGIFGYYFWDMRRTETSSSINKIAMYVCAAVVLMTFVAGFFIIDSPKVSRQKKLDQQVLNRAQSVDNSIQNYFSETGKLPHKIEDLQTTRYSTGEQNLEKISYKVTDSNGYELCADFIRSNLEDTDFENVYTKEWKHGEGNFCFKRTVLNKRDNVNPAFK
ncbi:MAG: hypothetical protein ACD_9C00133G0002 [uncultured bacterium]|nr:MAG: hypothetical protein ACD_9C00133G0002 [uncultured bacterium]